MHFGIAFLAAMINRVLPVPEGFWSATGHPVEWMGSLIDWMEPRLNRPELSNIERRRNGRIMLEVLLVSCLLAAMLVHGAIGWLPFSGLIEAVLAAFFLAHRELAASVRKVADALGQSTDAGREAVSHIVGRDVSELDEAGISRAAIESLAENSSDGVIAPLFWFCLFGLPGIIVYKAINTADSMVGYKSDRYLHFGWASARLDDLVNWLPARLTGLLYAAASAFVRRASVSDAWAIMRRDAPKHVSPNAGWPEAAMAGAMGYGLGGPRAYNGKNLNLPGMGDGRRDLNAGDIRESLTLYDAMTTVAIVLVLVLSFLIS